MVSSTGVAPLTIGRLSARPFGSRTAIGASCSLSSIAPLGGLAAGRAFVGRASVGGLGYIRTSVSALGLGYSHGSPRHRSPPGALLRPP